MLIVFRLAFNGDIRELEDALSKGQVRYPDVGNHSQLFELDLSSTLHRFTIDRTKSNYKYRYLRPIQSNLYLVLRDGHSAYISSICTKLYRKMQNNDSTQTLEGYHHRHLFIQAGKLFRGLRPLCYNVYNFIRACAYIYAYGMSKTTLLGIRSIR